VSHSTFRFNLAWFSTWEYGTTYSVRVKVRVVREDGTEFTTEYGDACLISTPPVPPTNPATDPLDNLETALSGNDPNNEISVTIASNPNNGESLSMELNGLSHNTQIIVTDIRGNNVLNEQLVSDKKEHTTTLKFDTKLASGIYLVTVISGNKKTTEKLFVK
jgi:hypothetical protein